MAKKDPGEYDYEGDMAMSQLKSIITNAKRLHDMLDPDTNLPEWVQSKITLAEDYVVTAANYMEGAMNEGLEPHLKAAQREFDLQAAATKKNTQQAGTMAAKREREKRKSAEVALKALNLAKGKKNKINVTPELDGGTHAKV